MLTVVTGPSRGVTGAALARAHELMSEAGLNIVRPAFDALETALRARGYGRVTDEGLAHA